MDRHLIAILVPAVLCGCTDSRGILLGDATDADAPAPDAIEEPVVDPVHDPVTPDDPPPDVPDIVEEPPWPCTPEFASQRRTILGGLSVSSGPEDEPDRPDLATLPSGEVWLSGRIWSTPSATDTPKLTLVKVNPVNALPGGSWHHPVRFVDLEPDHPIAPLGDSMVLVYPDRGELSAGEILAMRMDEPPDSGELTAMPDTDILSTRPAVASNGSEAMVVWRQADDTGMGTTIGYGIMDAAGSIISSGTVAGTGAETFRGPAIVHAGDRYAIAFFEEARPELWFVETGEDGERMPESDYRGDHGAELRGRPAMAWTGSRYGLALEANGMGLTTLTFCFVSLGVDALECHVMNDVLEPTVGPITAEQPGMLDIAWNGSRFGVVWVHVDPVVDRERVWFFEMDAGGAIVGGPHLLNPDSTRSRNPAITWVENGEGAWWVFAWNEFSESSGVHVTYAYSYGCSY